MKHLFPSTLRSLAIPLSLVAAQLVPNAANAQNTSIPYDEIYEQLFEASPGEGSGMFLEVDKIGIDTFPGSNTNGQTFTATLESIDELDITDPDFLGTLTPSQLNFYQGIDHLSWVRGAVWNSNSRVEFAGNVIERTTGAGSVFELQPALYLDSIAQIYTTPEPDDICPSGSFVIPVHGPGASPGCLDCWLDYSDALQDARADYFAAFQQAQSDLADAASIFADAADAAVEQAQEEMHIAGRLIGWDPGAALLHASHILHDLAVDLAALANQYGIALGAFHDALTEAASDFQAAQTDALNDLLACLAECDSNATTVIIGFYYVTWNCFGATEQLIML